MSDESKKTKWEHFPHDADVGIRGTGPTKARAFEQAALALTAVIADPDTVDAVQKIEITCEAPDDELLFVDWLNCLLYEMATRRMLFGRFEVGIDHNMLSGAAWGEKMDIARHEPVVEVKAATYAELAVRQQDDGTWVAQCIVDV